MPTHRRARGQRGLALVMTSLVLIPLMIFAAFGVDLAGWYARISFLQKGADAAALAGTVWMPNLTQATVEATASLRSNGIVDGQDGIEVTIERGATPTSLRVELSDTDADRFFSRVIGGSQSLTRSAEAEYNLPLPLGSPLNYFGGDRTRTAPTPVSETAAAWPTDYTTRTPLNSPCNVGVDAGQNLGRWNGDPVYQPGQHFDSGTPNRRCLWSVVGQAGLGANSAVPPPDYTTRQPTNASPGPGCRVHVNGTGTVIGRWNGANFSTNTNGTDGFPACTWAPRSTVASSVPPTSHAPTNRPCRVGYETSLGWWPASGGHSTASVPVGDAASTGNQLCQWTSLISTIDVTPLNPIAVDRSPGFWAAIGGPGDVAAFGDAFSARCTTSVNCGSTPNQMHRTAGYWYVIEMPAAGSATTTVRVFDAAYNSTTAGGSNPSTTGAGDTRANFAGGNGFTTTFRVYRQTNPLDFNARVPLGPSTPTTTGASCHWALRTQAEYELRWRDLCAITPANGEIYLLNVVTSATTSDSDGVNGYAIEAVASGSPTGPQQPAVFAFDSMGLRNNISGGTATFYLAEVGPQYAGKTLVVDLFDAGDATGNAFLQPVMPKTLVSPPTWMNIPSGLCSYTASPAPNPPQSGGDGGSTSPPVVNPTTPTIANCTIQTTVNGTQQFNDEWLQIRIDIPLNYACTLGVNPETTTGSCWWGVRYDFSNATANDVTTWQARVEGNPVQLTQ